jgi:hypothetical protein
MVELASPFVSAANIEQVQPVNARFTAGKEIKWQRNPNPIVS